MNLKIFYKKKLYEYAYEKGWKDKERSDKGEGVWFKNPGADIHFEDEIDYNICAEYYGQYVGDVNNWSMEDVKFLWGLGFCIFDFEEGEENE